MLSHIVNVYLTLEETAELFSIPAVPKWLNYRDKNRPVVARGWGGGKGWLQMATTEQCE